jgi:hypothetical protein
MSSTRIGLCPFIRRDETQTVNYSARPFGALAARLPILVGVERGHSDLSPRYGGSATVQLRIAA